MSDGEEGSDEPAETTEASGRTVAPSIDSDGESSDIAALEQQITDLTAAVERQNERIEAQEETIRTLIDELRQGR